MAIDPGYSPDIRPTRQIAESVRTEKIAADKDTAIALYRKALLAAFNTDGDVVEFSVSTGPLVHHCPVCKSFSSPNMEVRAFKKVMEFGTAWSEVYKITCSNVECNRSTGYFKLLEDALKVW